MVGVYGAMFGLLNGYTFHMNQTWSIFDIRQTKTSNSSQMYGK